MRKFIILILILFPLHKAYAWQEGNCYKTKGKPKHLCANLAEGKKILVNLKELEHRIKTEIPNLQQRLKIKQDQIDLLKSLNKKADTAVKEQKEALARTEKVNAKLNGENRKILVTAEKYKKEAEKYKRDRWVWLGIGIGTGIVVTAAVVTAIALYAKPINLQVTAK